MKTILNISTAALLLVAATSQCLANLSLQVVSKDRAEKELGIRIATEPLGLGTNDIVVTVEFSPKGKLEGFSYARLEICPELKERPLVSASLLPTINTKDTVKLSFSIDPAYLSKSSLMIVLPPRGGFGSTGYIIDFGLKDSAGLQPNSIR
jgi:hypothetical protein